MGGRNLNQLIRAVANRDSSALSQIASQYPDKPSQGVVNEQAEQLVDALFRQFRQVFPAACATNLKTPADESAAKKQWILAFAENGITNREQLRAGMQWARSKDTPFMPSPGQFIEQCKAGICKEAGLPDQQELYRKLMKYCAERGFYECAENYPWESNAEFWMVTDLYNQMRALNLTESEVMTRCGKQLKAMASRINAGEDIPEPRKQIPILSIPTSCESAKSHIADIRAKFGLRGRNA